ncbi:MAG TPA: peptide deformylase [Candidatus Komeilibacteria bacterium]|nr:MAG: Peptide deformylase [Parcubacteria group bacterium GW2011_GWF2_45_11]KKT97700.1 MAG: Peptide deformylase [Parcubacteria group bacterium GW2011_GWC2_45_15]OGY92312.1 MAG: peptide deformylase [Candidatus Komeilibacteria bacterium RIFOXYA2_FULL_45_9]OGY95018.1 MAG: peptide deformylase [Candidatus Komeilibacteria bacterium RIFOXYC2_FULL_45_12]HBR13771.1 peptide deformylase [Candidatus Komeilibacteria bacterium]
MLNIIKYPDKILRQRTKKVAKIQEPEFQRFLTELSETMLKEDGIGLAASQVKSQLRVAVIKMKGGPEFLINPRICWRALFKKNTVDEGCLSFPGIYGLVKRPFWVKIAYKDKNGRRLKFRAEGLLATVIQHEIDHLNGVLFIDKIFKYTRGEDKVKALIARAKLNER